MRKIAPISIELTVRELVQAETVALLRASEPKNLPDRHGFTGDGIVIDRVGALAEAAGCKALGLHWNKHVNHFKLPDARHNIQFRGTDLESGSLIVRPDDDERDYFALVTGKPPHFQLIGWMHGSEAKQYKWLRAPNGRPYAWFVPQRFLQRDFSELLAT